MEVKTTAGKGARWGGKADLGVRLYRTLSRVIRFFSPKMKIEWEQPFEEGPCIFVANHMGARGPISMYTQFPLRDRTWAWITHEVLDPKELPAYVRKDYWWRPESKLAPLYNVTVPYLVTVIIPPILKGTPHIPVYRDQRVMLTMRQSLKTLKEGNYLLIFPEKASGWKGYQEEINTGWMKLCEMWGKLSKTPLRLYPLHIDLDEHVYRVRAPLYYDPEKPPEEQEPRLAEALGKGLRGERVEMP